MNGRKQKRTKLPILRASDIGWWDWDFEKDLVDCDERVKTLFGLPLNEPVKFDRILEHAHPDDRALLINHSRAIRSRTGSYESSSAWYGLTAVSAGSLVHADLPITAMGRNP